MGDLGANAADLILFQHPLGFARSRQPDDLPKPLETKGLWETPAGFLLVSEKLLHLMDRGFNNLSLLHRFAPDQIFRQPDRDPDFSFS
jgi:hypothetical protein